jgi:hypothetical protein
LNVEKLVQITFGGGINLEVHTSPPTSAYLPTHKSIPPHPQVDTNTEITPKIHREDDGKLADARLADADAPANGHASRASPIQENQDVGGFQEEERNGGGLKRQKVSANGKHPPKRDPRTNHPAIQAIFEVTGRYPRKDQYEVLIEIVGENP